MTPGDDVTVSDRGLRYWPPITPVAGRMDGSDVVQFHDSSGVVSVRGPLDDPTFIASPFAWLAVGDSAAHLTGAEVARLHDQLGRWLTMNGEADTEDSGKVL